MWTADAVASVDEYWWGGGCDGSKTVKVCPQNLSLTAQFAKEMWAAVPAGGGPIAFKTDNGDDGWQPDPTLAQCYSTGGRAATSCTAKSPARVRRPLYMTCGAISNMLVTLEKGHI